jgi:hypothetical protein
VRRYIERPAAFFAAEKMFGWCVEILDRSAIKAI